MDPFSITVGAISLAGATKKAVRGIKRLKVLRDAPQELHDLLAELSQFEEVLQAIQDRAHPSGSADFLLETLLAGAKDKIVEFDSLIEYRLTQAGSSSKVDRLGWTESRIDIDGLRKQVRDIRANLDVIIGIRTDTTVQHTLELMRQVHTDNQGLRQMATALACLPQLLGEVQSTSSAISGCLSAFRHLTLKSSHPDARSVPDTTHNSVAQPSMRNAYAGSGDELQLQKTFNVSHCRLDCLCECHRKSFSWSPRSLAGLFGRFYLENTGPSWLGTSRHIQSCRASAVSQTRVIYFIPPWFAMKAIYILFTSSPTHGPEWLIRIPRLVDTENSRAFKSIYRADFLEFKSAIASGECTPYDINEYGCSILYLVIYYWRYDMLVHLVRMGIDVLQPVDPEHNWSETLWKSFVGERRSRPEGLVTGESLPLQALVPNFPWDEYKERKGFTLLHEIVCRISGRDLDNAVQSHPADINRLDHNGRSPLEMAIRHENIAAIRKLLRRGADPNICHGMPICAALSTSLDIRLMITELLLRSGATIYGSARDNIGAKWINISGAYGSSYPELLAVDKLLIEHGVNINHQAHLCHGRTLLLSLCLCSLEERSSLDRIEHLIALGADLEIRDSSGKTALHYTIEFDSSEIMKILFRAGARFDVETNKGDTVAHLAVIFSMSIGFVKALSEMNLETVDLDTKNEDGYTAYDLLRMRNGLRWEKYSKKLYESRYDDSAKSVYCGRMYPEDDYQVILALEALLHHIQDSHGIPKDQQYPPLGEYLSDDKDENPVPGAWPL